MTFEHELKTAISRQNQNVCNLLEQYDEMLEIVDNHYIDKQKVKDAIEKEPVNWVISSEEYKQRLLKKLELDK